MKIPAVLLACVLSGCAAPQSGSQNAPPLQLEGSKWSLATATDSQGVIGALVNKPGKPVAIAFEKGRVGISEACNHMGGAYTLTGSTLKVERMMSTRMACEPALMKAEAEIGRQIEGSSQAEMAGDQLVLKTAQGATLSFDRNQG